MKISYFATLLVIFLSNFLFLQAQQSALVYPGTDGKMVYTPHVNNGETNNANIIPDFSYAGYMDGGVKVPVGEAPVKVTLNPTATGEDRTRIQAAIDQVCNLGPDANGFRGAILLKKGTYRVNDGNIQNLTDGYGYALRIWTSGVVLRGEGQGMDCTILYSDYALNHTMITIEPLSHGISETNIQRISDDYVGTGANTITVANAGSYAVGDLIIVKFTPNDTWFSDLKVTTGGYIINPADYWTVTGEKEAYRISFKRKITAINGNTITIECPVVQPMQTKYGGGQISKYTTSGRLTKCGVEDLRIVGIEDDGSPSVSTNENRLRVGIRPRFIDNSWVHGVTVTRSSEAAIMTWDAMNMTIEESAYIDPRGPITGGWRYGFCLDAGSTRVLFQRCYSEYGRHDFVTHARIPGPNVFLDCLSEHGLNVLGPHHRWAAGTLFDNIKASSSMEITEFADPSAGHAWCGAQTVGWNLECASYVCDAAIGSQNYLIGSIGNESQGAVSHDAHPESIYRGYWENSGPGGIHMTTRSLYLKQLEDRLGNVALTNITIPDQLVGNIYANLSSWAGNSLFYSANVAVSNVEILPVTATVFEGNTKQLTTTFSPWDASNKSVIWTSGDTSVASVSSTGLVTAIAPGTTTIKATTVDGARTGTSVITVTTDPAFFSRTLQAENAIYHGAVVASNNSGYNGSGFIDFLNASGDDISWTVNIPAVGSYTLSFRYAITSGNRPLSLTVNGTVKVPGLDFPGTGSVTTWNNITTIQDLIAGNNTITLTSIGSNGGNIDELVVAGSAVAPVSVLSVSVSPTIATLSLYTTRQLTAIVLPANAVNKNITWSSSNPSVATINATGIVTATGTGTATISATTHDGGKIASSEITVTPSPVNSVLSNCDAASGWTSANTLSVNSVDKKEGTGCLQSVGTNTDEFKKLFSQPINTGTTIPSGKIQFWYFVSDVTLFSAGNQVELGSGGMADVNEFNWKMGTLVNGWNLVTLPFSSAGVMGTPDLSAINWFRIYHSKTGSITTKIDQIMIVDSSVSNSVSDYYPETIKIYAHPLNQNTLIIKLDDNYIWDDPEIIITNLQAQIIYRNRMCKSKTLEINMSGLPKSSICLVSVKSGCSIITRKIIVP